MTRRQDGECGPPLEQVLALGRSAGLSSCGVASCAPSDHGARLDAWLAAGAHGSMAWMERTASIRKELTSKWEWARSALVATLSYLSEPVDRHDAGGVARHLARYARRRDYHDVLKERLLTWRDALGSAGLGFTKGVALVDTSAVLERELALRAGLGWIGKNTCLIAEGGDSWRFLGVLLIDCELPETGPPVADRCGTCTACLEVCPTGALPEPYFLDARRCISYLTIEHRGPIDEPLASETGDWLFGCDLCQEVCPWNRRVVPSGDDAFATDPAIASLELAELAALDDAAFRARFRGTPLFRSKRAGLVRNALIVGANLGDEDVRAVARDLVDDPDPGVRAAARRALGEKLPAE